MAEEVIHIRVSLFRQWVKLRAVTLYPRKATGTVGRDSGGGLTALAAMVGIHLSRLSHILKKAEHRGHISVDNANRIGTALGFVEGEAMVAAYREWFKSIKETP